MMKGSIITDSVRAVQIAHKLKRVAVLGCQTDAKADRPAYYVPQALQASGIEIVPVPIYAGPEVTHILGQPVYRRLVDIPAPPLDAVDVFRKPEDLGSHLEDLLAAKPAVVWLQTGISERAFEEALAAEGITVVVSRCLMVDRRQALSNL